MSCDTGDFASTLKTWISLPSAFKKVFSLGIPLRAEAVMAEGPVPNWPLQPRVCGAGAGDREPLRSDGFANKSGVFCTRGYSSEQAVARGRMLMCTHWGCRRALGGIEVQRVLEGAPRHGCFSRDVALSLLQPVRVASRPAPCRCTRAAGQPAWARTFAKYLHPRFVHCCDF